MCHKTKIIFSGIGKSDIGQKAKSIELLFFIISCAIPPSFFCFVSERTRSGRSAIIDKILIDQRYRPKIFSPHKIGRNFVYKPSIKCILKCRNIKSATRVFKKMAKIVSHSKLYVNQDGGAREGDVNKIAACKAA